MKKLLIIFLFSVILITSNKKAYAAHCICFDPIVFDAITIDKTAIMAAKDVLAAIAEQSFNASWFLQINLDIMANSAKRLAVKNIGQNITNWANGGFQGDPTFVVNPEMYFKNIETSGIRAGINEITKAGGDLLSDSISNTIAKNYRQENSPISQKTTFTLGQTIQDNICNDANLSQMAKNAVADSFNNTNYTAKKAELANSLCSGNASTDKNTQQAMVNIYKSNFSAGGGWGSWLDLTTNRNNTAYGNVSSAKQAVSEKVEKKTEVAKEELDTNGGYLGTKKCIKEVFLETEGITACDQYETITPGSLNFKKLEGGLSGPLDTLRQGQGFTDIDAGILGGMIDGVLGDFLTKGLSGMAKTITSSKGINSNQSFTLDTGTYTKEQARVSLDQNTSLTETEKTNILNKILNELDNKMTTINNLKKIDRSSYLSYLVSYENKVNELANKYNILIGEFPSYNEDILVTAGRSYIRERRTEIGNFRNRLINDDESLAEAERITKETKSKILASNNISEIQVIFQEYQDLVVDGKIPETNSETVIDLEYKNTKESLEKDFASTLDSKITMCNNTLNIERAKKACLAQGQFWSWTGSSCYFEARKECLSRGTNYSWSGSSCINNDLINTSVNNW